MPETIQHHCNQCGHKGAMNVLERWRANETDWVALGCPECGERGHWPAFWNFDGTGREFDAEWEEGMGRLLGNVAKNIGMVEEA